MARSGSEEDGVASLPAQPADHNASITAIADRTTRKRPPNIRNVT